MKMPSKDARKLARRLERGGAQFVGYSSTNHPKFRCPDGSTHSIPNSPSDRRSWRNVLATFRRAGVTGLEDRGT